MTLPRPPGVYTAKALGINDDGWVVGEFDFTSDGLAQLAFLYRHGVMQSLGTLPGGNFSEVGGINSRGVIVGSWGNSGTGIPTSTQAYLWRNGRMRDLGPALGSVNSVGADINERDSVAGWRRMEAGASCRAFLLVGDKATDLGMLPGWFWTEARALNNRDEVVGAARIATDEQKSGFVRHAFFWSEGVMSDLGVLPGTLQSFARDVNDHGQVVGVCEPEFGAPRAFLWQNGVMRDLNTLLVPGTGVVVKLAEAINNAGQITGYGNFQGPVVALLLTPVPLPAADLNGDYVVDTSDLSMLLANWSLPNATKSPGCRGARVCPADLNGDGLVNTIDLGILLSSWTL